MIPLLAPTACDFELSGAEGFVESSQISGEARVLHTEAVDCRWHIRAPPRSKVWTTIPPLPLTLHPHPVSSWFLKVSGTMGPCIDVSERHQSSLVDFTNAEVISAGRGITKPKK